MRGFFLLLLPKKVSYLTFVSLMNSFYSYLNNLNTVDYEPEHIQKFFRK
jgi:hypothetical protein